jgi:hypothetical protein
MQYHYGRYKLSNDFDWHANPQGEVAATSDEATRPPSRCVNKNTAIIQIIVLMRVNLESISMLSM